MFRDLYFTLNFVREFITQNNLLDLYQQVVNNFQQLQAGRSEEADKAFQDSRGNLVNTLSLVNFSSWSPAKLSIMKHIGGYDLLGVNAVERLDEIFSNNLGSPATIVQKLDEVRAETNTLMSKAQQIMESLQVDSKVSSLDKGHKIVELAFQNRASLTNFWEIEDRSGELNYIIRTVTRLTGTDFESAKIISISTASDPISIALDLLQKTGDSLLALAKAGIEIKKLKDLFLQKKKNARELGLSKETVKIVVKELETQKEESRKVKIGELSVKITKEFRSAKPDANDQHEIESMVGIAMEKLSNLINDGFKVLDPDEIKPVGEAKQAVMGNAYAEARKIEKKVEPLLLEEATAKTKQRRKKMQKALQISNENNRGAKENGVEVVDLNKAEDSDTSPK